MRHDTAFSVLRQCPIDWASRPLREAAERDPQYGVRSLYIHVPFCFHKCHYCDFYSLVDTRDRQPAFVERLVRELAALAPWGARGPVKTIFVGGGTPSLLRADLWNRLLEALHARYDLSLMGPGPGEFTVECNPETVTPDLARTLAAGGVNRVSLGAQSFDPRHLRTLERWHDPVNVERALGMVKGAGIERVSLDLIFAIPGQTLDDWRADLDHVLGLGVDHLSCYNLTYEPNTAMTARLRRGEFLPADEDVEIAMHELTLRATRAAGLHRYEVSNFAAHGQECRHNLAYWRQEQWLAAGPSASAHVAGHRWKNVARLDDYLSGDDGEGFAPITDHEPPDGRRALQERIMTGLRLSEGLDAAQMLAQSAPWEGASARLAAAVGRWETQGHLESAGGLWRLTDSGFLLADAIARDLMGAIR